MAPTTKIIFNEPVINAVEQAAAKTGINTGKTTRIVFKNPETSEKDLYESVRKTVVPFYNKILPKFLRKTTNIEFYPNNKIIKSKNVYNHKNQIIQSELFDEHGMQTYFEKYNPKTKYSYTKVAAKNKVIEQEMRGEILLRKEERDINGKLLYKYIYDPKKDTRVIKEFTDGLLTETKTINGKKVYEYRATQDGGFIEEYQRPNSPRKYTYVFGHIEDKNGKKSQDIQFKKLEIFNKEKETKTVYEYLPKEEKYSYTHYDENGIMLNRVTWFGKTEIQHILTKLEEHK